MAQRSQVPEFGNWESKENVPYTKYFDKARKGKGGVRMNPNDPQDNTPPVRAPPFQQEAEVKGEMGTSDVKSKPETERQTSRKDDELQNYGGVGSGSSKAESDAQKGSDALRPTNECREEGDLSRAADSSLRHETGETLLMVVIVAIAMIVMMSGVLPWNLLETTATAATTRLRRIICGSGVKVCVKVRRVAKTRLPPAGEAKLLDS
ncbi:hypothetical protein CsSME_00052374 [Camellia sinensis var. sinensis]